MVALGVLAGLFPSKNSRREEAQRDRQHIAVSLPADLPLIQADATLVEQAVGNVVGNAIGHTPNEANVTIDSIIETNRLSLRVTDDGPGISSSVLPRIFDKFVRGEPGSNRADGGEGTGLGLAITKGIMEAHGGSVAAESPVEHGRGTRISLTFARSAVPA